MEFERYLKVTVKVFGNSPYKAFEIPRTDENITGFKIKNVMKLFD